MIVGVLNRTIIPRRAVLYKNISSIKILVVFVHTARVLRTRSSSVTYTNYGVGGKGEEGRYSVTLGL